MLKKKLVVDDALVITARVWNGKHWLTVKTENAEMLYLFKEEPKLTMGVPLDKVLEEAFFSDHCEIDECSTCSKKINDALLTHLTMSETLKNAEHLVKLCRSAYLPKSYQIPEKELRQALFFDRDIYNWNYDDIVPHIRMDDLGNIYVPINTNGKYCYKTFKG